MMSLNGFAIGILFLPCFFLLVIASEALTRLATRLMQMHVRSHFDWPQGSLFSRPSAALFQQCKQQQQQQLCVKRYLQCGEGTVQCVFCLNEMSDGEEMRELRCGHIFHRACLDEWLEHKWATCPVCRDVIAAAEDAEGEEMGLAVISSYYRHNWWMW